MTEDEASRFGSCRCFTTDNIFLEDFQLHVRFESEERFRLRHGAQLRKLGCVTEQQFAEVLNKVSQEVDRRRRLGVTSAQRAAAIRDTYRPLHPHVYRLQDSFLAPGFLRLVDYSRSSGASRAGLRQLLEEAAPRVYRFPVFQKSFCDVLLEELENFERSGVAKGRPNTMNRHGVLLDELGFDEAFITPLRERYLSPLAALLYPDCGGRCLDSHKAFTVKYDMEEDLALSRHYDNAEVTLNVSLGKDFTGGDLYFGAMRTVAASEAAWREVAHQVGAGVLHRGQQMHGARPLRSGQRWNLVVWMRASPQRNRLCPMCDRRPALQRGRGFADGFTADDGAGGFSADDDDGGGFSAGPEAPPSSLT